jgi:hypothetical protein
MERDKSALYQLLKSRRKGRVLCMPMLPSLLAELAQQKSLRFQEGAHVQD